MMPITEVKAEPGIRVLAEFRNGERLWLVPCPIKRQPNRWKDEHGGSWDFAGNTGTVVVRFDRG